MKHSNVKFFGINIHGNVNPVVTNQVDNFVL